MSTYKLAIPSALPGGLGRVVYQIDSQRAEQIRLKQAFSFFIVSFQSDLFLFKDRP